jgi:predicted phosphodiesterase
MNNTITKNGSDFTVTNQDTKLRVSWISDMHLDFHDNFIDVLQGKLDNTTNADVLVIAGDTCEHTFRPKIQKVFEYLYTQYKYIIEIPGNHNYWTLNKNNNRHRPYFESFKEEIKPGQHWYVNDTTLEIQGVSFICSCLWSHISPLEHYEIQSSMNDYVYIRNFTAVDSDHQHKRSRSFIEQELKKPGKKIVISHHLPSYKLIDPTYSDAAVNSAYASHLEDLFEYEFEVWIHGHSHSRVDEMILDRRFVRTPLGYPRQNIDTTLNFIDL